MTTEYYDSNHRMKVNPEFHSSHFKAWKTSDEKWLIENYIARGAKNSSMALERTESAVLERVRQLRKQGRMPKFIAKGKRHDNDTA